MTDEAPKIRRLLDWDGLEKKGVGSRNQILRDIRAGRFRAPFLLGPKRPRWWEDEIDADISAMPRGIAPVCGRKKLPEDGRDEPVEDQRDKPPRKKRA
jgi:predicted DNA-binding transcriptional regulator AlpA